MVQPPLPAQPALPKPLKTARIILWIQVVATALFLIFQYIELASIEQHGEELSGIGHVEIIENPIVFILALTAAIFVASQRPWAWSLAIIVELLAIVNGIINAVSGLPAGIAAVGLAIVVIGRLLRPEVTAWFGRTPRKQLHR